jgi:hypothetical protein
MERENKQSLVFENHKKRSILKKQNLFQLDKLYEKQLLNNLTTSLRESFLIFSQNN